MRVLFDQGVPVPLRDHLAGHEVRTAYELCWSTLRNGDLLARAELQFDALVTTDRNLGNQQNLSGRQLAILVLPTTSWPRLQKVTNRIASAIAALEPGQLIELAP